VTPPSVLPPVTLVLGGARSGKSRLAEEMVEGFAAGTAAGSTGTPVYLATAEAGDGEMSERIRHHRDRRGPHWHTVEEPLNLIGALRSACAPDRAVLVDCLTLWVTNLMLADRDVDAEGEALAGTLGGLAGPVVFVSNEVGLGIVPDNTMARAFRDHAGRLHQAIAARAHRVYFVVAGLPMILKDVAAG